MRGARLLDVALATAGVVVFGPVIGLVALAILSEDGGPALFKQVRLGQHREPFTVLKLRSMRDGEVTRVGRWVRATGIDETTQFWCVLRGDMSVVGPRPLTEADVVRLGWHRPEHDARFDVPPGITGLAQLFAVSGVGSSEAMDRAYAREASTWLDLQLVAASFACNLLGKRRVKRWLSGHRYATLAVTAGGCDRAIDGACTGSG